jgi:hypothetical protein
MALARETATLWWWTSWPARRSDPCRPPGLAICSPPSWSPAGTPRQKGPLMPRLVAALSGPRDRLRPLRVEPTGHRTVVRTAVADAERPVYWCRSLNRAGCSVPRCRPDCQGTGHRRGWRSASDAPVVRGRAICRHLSLGRCGRLRVIAGPWRVPASSVPWPQRLVSLGQRGRAGRRLPRLCAGSVAAAGVAAGGAAAGGLDIPASPSA